VIPPEEIMDAVHARSGRHVMLTFDDGYRDNYEIAFPLLRSYGVHAVFFLATGYLDAPRAPWWDDIAWMVDRADARTIEIGAAIPGKLSLAQGDKQASVARL